MPELPEVQTVVDGLNKLIKDKTIKNTNVFDHTVIGFPNKEDFIKRTENKKILCILRKGKYILIKLADDLMIVIHLRMSGKLLFKNREQLKDKHTHLIFEFDDNSDLRFNNVRKFGRLYVVNKKEVDKAGNLRNLGVEPLSEEFDFNLFIKMLKKRKGMIKPLLMNQEFIAGMGNIYTDEALYLAKIRPDRKADSLNRKEVKRLYNSLQKVLKKGIKMGGTTFSDYVNALGESGQFQYQLKVYNQEGTSCKICGEKIVKEKISGRATRYCPECQN